MPAAKQRTSATRRKRGASASPTKKATQERKNAVATQARKNRDTGVKRATSRRAKASGAGARRETGGGAKKAAGGAAKKAAGSVAQKASDAVKPSAVKHPIQRTAIAVARKGLKLIARKALGAGGGSVRAAAEKTAAAGKGGLSKPPPIQVSVDVAVPLEFAWQEWMTFQSFTEGVHRIEDVERDGDRLRGRAAAPTSTDWEAKIVDERECEDFVWRSVKGSDCAGLVAFRPLSERLTRIQLDLDVVPTSPRETLALTLNLARRRAEAELRRFKARLEFTSPDVYEPDLRRNGSGPENATDQKERS